MAASASASGGKAGAGGRRASVRSRSETTLDTTSFPGHGNEATLPESACVCVHVRSFARTHPQFLREWGRGVIIIICSTCNAVAYPGGVLGCSSTPLSRRVAEELGANDCRASVTVNGLVNVQARLLRFSIA